MRNKVIHFTTYDLNLSAVLLCENIPLVKITKNEDKKALFHFEHTEKLNKLLQDYWDQKLKVNPQELFSNLKQLKNRIYSNY